jgi:hypothetical protein
MQENDTFGEHEQLNMKNPDNESGSYTKGKHIAFSELEQLDLKDPENLCIFNVSGFNTKQKRRIMQYIKYRGWYSFGCNSDLYPIKSKIYICKKCGKKFGSKDFEQDFGTTTGAYYGSYIKCWHDDGDLDDERISLYYYGYEDDKDGELDFKILNRYNSIVATPICIPNYNATGKKSVKSLEMALNCIPVTVHQVKFADSKDKLHGSMKINEIMEAIGKRLPSEQEKAEVSL